MDGDEAETVTLKWLCNSLKGSSANPRDNGMFLREVIQFTRTNDHTLFNSRSGLLPPEFSLTREDSLSSRGVTIDEKQGALSEVTE